LGTIEKLEIKDGEEIKVKYRWVRGSWQSIFLAVLRFPASNFK
jgi:hypothetical protein